MLDACMQFENYSNKIVGEEAFYRNHILYHYFKIWKIRKKIKNSPIFKKKHKPEEWYHTWCLHAIWKLSD